LTASERRDSVVAYPEIPGEIPAAEVARRAGHGVAGLLKIYAYCIDGQADAASPSDSAPPSPSPALAMKATPTASRHPEMAGQQPDAERNGQYTAPSDGQRTAPALAVRARPWIPRLRNPVPTDA
jgi:hypothetical protein